jgi:hypothetical protein
MQEFKAFCLAFSVDKNCRHRGSDVNDSPLLLELEGLAGEGDVVLGGEQRDQTEHEAADRLCEDEPVEARPPMGGCF